ncbi:uncharacterized protein UV8b_08012 [Ustilaginoidea virens]|uniref:Uncharacterized protein n=1 Tax=Ustilaginoidea virens TaxID=1159556 RepID=A0A8E5HYA9_USTVR|nr:uncharacterized protein UV8b_08012 [Ustilaginoidea virens]QUC23771.1 hypothetical protein UV8b_08012 [Ustilaginoidea virens]
MALTSAVSDLFRSIYELFASLVAAVYAAVYAVFAAAQSVVVGLATAVRDVLAQAVHLTGGVAKFVTGNFVALAVGGLLVLGYLRVSASRRQEAVRAKKTQ